MPKIGNKLRAIRDERKLSQENMADLLGMSQSNYNRIEHNKYEVKLEELDSFAQKLDIQPQELFEMDKGSVINNFKNKIETQIGKQNCYQISPELKQLYEDKIALLEEKIKWLEQK